VLVPSTRSVLGTQPKVLSVAGDAAHSGMAAGQYSCGAISACGQSDDETWVPAALNSGSHCWKKRAVD
jgi:hypothetical protein